MNFEPILDSIDQAPVVAPPEPITQQPAPDTHRRSTCTQTQVALYQSSMTGKSYQYSATQLERDEPCQIEPAVVEFIMTQLLLKAALKMWGNDAEVAAESEMKQLHWRNSFRPVLFKELNKKQKQTIMEPHIFMKMKRTGEIKGRTVADGNEQRGYIDKEESSSPTVATESVIITSIVNAIEECQTAIIDIPNAFIQTVVEDKKKQVIIHVPRMLVDILVKIAPKVYKPFVTYDKKGNNQLLLECLNALDGTIVASLLYYQKFTRSLKGKGYEMNPYDPCV